MAGDAKDAEHFSYRATFEVYPEIALQPLDELAIEVPTVDDRGGRCRRHDREAARAAGDVAAVERKAAEGDRVVVDFAGTIDGEPFEGGQGKDVAIVVGSGQVLQDFDRALRGVEAGESTTATVLFPQDYPTKNLAGKTADVRASTCSASRNGSLPELDDEFAASFGVSERRHRRACGEVRNNMERELKERLRAETQDPRVRRADRGQPSHRAARARRPGNRAASGRCVAPDGQQRREPGAGSRAFRRPRASGA